MPSQITHLTIAKRYLAKHPERISDAQSFIDGNILPDLDPNKERSHCGVRSEMQNLPKRNLEKVNPERYLQTHRLDNDLNKGWYLHLYTDYQYYNVFLKEYCARVGFDQSSKDLYQTTQRDDQYMMQKYGVGYHDSQYLAGLEEINRRWGAEIKQLFGENFAFEYPYDLKALDEFIERMSDLPL